MRTNLQVHRQTSESGIALLMVLIITVVLGILAAGFAYTMKVETQLARNATFDSEMEWAGRSGLERARWTISLPGGPGGRAVPQKCLSQPWAGGSGDTNSAAVLLPLHFQLGNADIDIKIVDLDSKININSVLELPPPQAHDVLFNILRNKIGVDGDWAESIISALQDWRDPDDQRSGMGGAESDDYSVNPNPGYPPYVAKNGRIDDMSELLMVRGITPAIFWGPAFASHWQPRRRGNPSELDEPTFAVGMVDLFTATSSGRVNMHTASASTLEALLPPGGSFWIDTYITGATGTGRAGMDGADGTWDDMVFPSVPPLPFGGPGGPMPGAMPPGAAPMMPGAPGMPGMRPGAPNVPGNVNPNTMFSGMSLIGTDSLYFQATVNVTINSRTRTYVGLLGPAPQRRDVQVLNMYWK